MARGYALEDFVHDLKPILASETDVATALGRGSPLLERLIRSRDSVPTEYRAPAAGKSLSRYVLYRESPHGLCVSVVVWGPGAHLGPHDHHTWGMIGVFDNTIEETRFRRLDDGSDPDHAHLERERVNGLKQGEISLLVPGVDEIHQMDNRTDRPTVEVHVYGQDLTSLKRCLFDPETGRVTSYGSRKYDNE